MGIGRKDLSRIPEILVSHKGFGKLIRWIAFGESHSVNRFGKLIRLIALTFLWRDNDGKIEIGIVE